MANHQLNLSPFNLALLSIFFTLLSSKANAAIYNVLTYGAKADVKTDSTRAFLAVWTQSCASTKPATSYVPPGRFFLGNVAFEGPCKNNAILVRIDGTLVAPTNYWVLAKPQNWIVFRRVNGVTLSGGEIDGQGTSLWSCKASAGRNCPTGATVGQLPPQASGVKISDVTYGGIHGTSATQIAIRFDCSKMYPCTRLRLNDVKLTYNNGPAGASCNNAGGTASGIVSPTSCL